jgi:hypothetical protein
MSQGQLSFNRFHKLILLYFCLFQACSNYKNYHTMKYQLDFYTEYNQFYICDKASERATGSDNFWTIAAYEDRMAQEKGVLGVGTQSYGHIKCELDILNTANNLLDTNQYDHIVEAGVKITSGILQVLSCPTSEVELEVKIKPGTYRIRVYSSKLSTADIDEDEGNDRYKIEIWPDTNMERKVLKRYVRK